jgi:hypothetical protein
MAIRKEEEKKVGMKITDNMDGEKKANEKLNMRKADVFNMRDYLKYKDAIQNDKDLKDVFPPNYPVRQLEIFQQLLETQEDKS